MKAVKAAEKAYSDWADFQVADGRKIIKVAIKNIKPEIARNFISEFCNYVLGLTAADKA